jgi:hypothetical protein
MLRGPQANKLNRRLKRRNFHLRPACKAGIPAGLGFEKDGGKLVAMHAARDREKRSGLRSSEFRIHFSATHFLASSS